MPRLCQLVLWKALTLAAPLSTNAAVAHEVCSVRQAAFYSGFSVNVRQTWERAGPPAYPSMHVHRISSESQLQSGI